MAYDGKVLRQATLRFDEDKQRRQEQQRQRQQQTAQGRQHGAGRQQGRRRAPGRRRQRLMDGNAGDKHQQAGGAAKHGEDTDGQRCQQGKEQAAPGAAVVAQLENMDQQRQGQVVQHFIAERPGHADEGQSRIETRQQEEIAGQVSQRLRPWRGDLAFRRE